MLSFIFNLEIAYDADALNAHLFIIMTEWMQFLTLLNSDTIRFASEPTMYADIE